MVAVEAGWTIFGFKAPAKLPPNESITPTLKPLRVDRAPASRGAGLFAVVHGAWGLGPVTPKTKTFQVPRR